VTQTRGADISSDRYPVARDHARNRVWLIPALMAFGALVLGVTLTRWDVLHRSIGGFGYLGDVSSAQTTMATIAAAMLTFMGLVFTITVVALQLASGQFSPRVLRTFQRDRRTQLVLGTFMATFVFSLAGIAELGEVRADAAPILMTVAFVMVGASLVAFVGYLQHITTSLRAVHIIEAVAVETRRVIDGCYPADGGGKGSVGVDPPADRATEIVGAPSSGVIAAVDLGRLVRRARADDVVVRVLHPVGTYLAQGAPLLEISGTQLGDLRRLVATVDLAVARTMFQDVEFGLRQLVDIAERALSPAVNDPTTAVQALDRIGDLLRRIVVRPDPPEQFVDPEGVVRVQWIPPSWDALVRLSFAEIAWFGRESIQLTRRLEATITELLELAPESRRHVLIDERERLAAYVELAVPPSYRAEALTADHLGLGTN